MSDSLKVRIQEDTKQAMKARDKQRLSALRTLSAAIKQKEVDERAELDDSQVLSVIQKQIKQHQESLEHSRQAGRDDLVEQTEAELELLKSYLPEPLSEEELEALIDEAIQSTGASSVKEMGQVMSQLKPKIEGRADMSQVSQKVKTRLSSSS